MSGEGAAQDLLDSLQHSLDLLRDYATDQEPFDPERAEPMPTLLEQCATLAAKTPQEQPIRSIHHMACTGGTLICKGLSVMPNVTLLSEVDPLSHMGLPRPRATPPFRPTDLIYAARVALRPVDDALAGRMGLAAIEVLRKSLAEEGRQLCLRDHAHSQYCTGDDPEGRPSLYDMLRDAGPVLSVVTVRHPLDAFLSLQKNAWLHFRPDTLEEYARRYSLFLDHHVDLPIFRYEDFVAAPETVLKQICAVLELVYEPGVETLLPIVQMSGDSGRKSNRRIAPRPRRAVPDVLAREAGKSPTYQQLCDRLGYDA